IADYETTSTALAYTSHVLVTHPNEHLKLQEHIGSRFNPDTDNEVSSYETISKMEYLDMFIGEALRIYPIAPVAINRQSTKDFHISHNENVLAVVGNVGIVKNSWWDLYGCLVGEKILN
ncbi:unnamed protein product, partial [Rotaria socialis]